MSYAENQESYSPQGEFFIPDDAQAILETLAEVAASFKVASMVSRNAAVEMEAYAASQGTEPYEAYTQSVGLYVAAVTSRAKQTSEDNHAEFTQLKNHAGYLDDLIEKSNARRETENKLRVMSRLLITQCLQENRDGTYEIGANLYATCTVPEAQMARIDLAPTGVNRQAYSVAFIETSKILPEDWRYATGDDIVQLSDDLLSYLYEQGPRF